MVFCYVYSFSRSLISGTALTIKMCKMLYRASESRSQAGIREKVGNLNCYGGISLSSAGGARFLSFSLSLILFQSQSLQIWGSLSPNPALWTSPCRNNLNLSQLWSLSFPLSPILSLSLSLFQFVTIRMNTAFLSTSLSTVTTPATGYFLTSFSWFVFGITCFPRNMAIQIQRKSITLIRV